MTVKVWCWHSPWPFDACDTSLMAVASSSRADAHRLARAVGVRLKQPPNQLRSAADASFVLRHPGEVCVRSRNGGWQVAITDGGLSANDLGDSVLIRPE